MRATILLAFALTWISACVGCGAKPPAASPALDTQALADVLEHETVAMVALVDDSGESDPSGTAKLFCAGVWIAPHAFLTAGHCAEHMRTMHGGESVVGQPVLYSLERDDLSGAIKRYWRASVVAYSRESDLALVWADQPQPHGFAVVSGDSIRDGEFVAVVGHPAGYAWSFVAGVVSASRPAEPNAREVPMPTLQVCAPISGGNSGGGAFDRHGRLIGIASYGNQRANGMGFYVHRDAIQAFLRVLPALSTRK